MSGGHLMRRYWASLVDLASEPYRRAGTFAWHFARGKLGRDPVFHYMVSEGLIAPRAHVLDIGCGQGLLTSLLRACHLSARQGQWPRQWPRPPEEARVTGIDMSALDIQRARTSLGDSAGFVCGDMRQTPFPEADAVVILDVLHYVAVPEQNEVLARVRRSLSRGGLLLLRVGDASQRHRFRFSQWVDALVVWGRGHPVRPLFGRTLAEWSAHLESLGFEVRSQPMSQGTPFANVLLVAKVGAAR